MRSGQPYRFTNYCKGFTLIILFNIFQSTEIYSQVRIDGKVVEENTNPVPFASIKLMNEPAGSASDASGNFSLHLGSVRKNDTLMISSVGYEILKIPAARALKEKLYVLKPVLKKMEDVVIRSFSKEEVAGAQTDIVGYFRGWNTFNRGGEIGRVFNVPYKEYQVARVRFKMYSSCDTCIVRLHIRDMASRVPGDELLKDSVAQIFIKTNVADKSYDFDLSKYNLILSRENIFVSFELLKGSGNVPTCSFSFAGDEHGQYIYKTTGYDPWDESNDYSIYMKVFFRHD